MVRATTYMQMENMVCVAQHINMGTRITFQHGMSGAGEAIRVERARKPRATHGFKLDRGLVKKQRRVGVPFKAAATAESEVNHFISFSCVASNDSNVIVVSNYVPSTCMWPE